MTRDGDLANAEQIEQIAVAAGLLLHPFIRVDEEEGGLGIGRAGHHVFEKFLVARRINNDLLPLFRLKPNLREVSMVMF